MTLKRPKGDPGTLVVLEHDSKILVIKISGACAKAYGWSPTKS